MELVALTINLERILKTSCPCSTFSVIYFYSEDNHLSYDVAVIQWLTSCHKNRMTTRYITLGYWRVTS